jgi:hypothetical protein
MKIDPEYKMLELEKKLIRAEGFADGGVLGLHIGMIITVIAFILFGNL